MLEFCEPLDWRGRTFIDALLRRLNAAFIAEIIERGAGFEIVISVSDSAGKRLLERIFGDDLRFSINTALDALDRVAAEYAAAR
jgi:hypothetical protein